MARTPGSLNVRTLDFFIKFEECVRQYDHHPVEFLFRIAAGLDKSEDWGTHRLTAAQKLVDIRYPKVKMVEVKDLSVDEDSDQDEMTFSWQEPEQLVAANAYTDTVPTETAAGGNTQGTP